MSSSTKAPMWFLIVSIIALLWNLIGLWGFTTSFNLGPEDMADVPERMRGYYEAGVPWFYWAAYGLAVIAGVLGCILLLLKRKLATLVFILSIVGILIFNTWSFLISDMAELMITEDYVIQSLVIGIAILLLFLSKRAERKAWIV